MFITFYAANLIGQPFWAKCNSPRPITSEKSNFVGGCDRIELGEKTSFYEWEIIDVKRCGSSSPSDVLFWSISTKRPIISAWPPSRSTLFSQFLQDFFTLYGHSSVVIARRQICFVCAEADEMVECTLHLSEKLENGNVIFIFSSN